MLGVLVLIPAFNEESHIEQVVRKALTHLPVLVIDDGSTDRTAAIAVASGASVVSQENRGKGSALINGFGWAIHHGYQAVITLDGDGQHDPDEIPLFLNLYEKNLKADLIIGVRQFREMPLRRRIPNTVSHYLFSLSVGQKIADNQSGFRLVTRRLMSRMLVSGTKKLGFDFELEMIAKAIQIKSLILEVPISTIYGSEKSKIKPLVHLTKFLGFVAHNVLKEIGHPVDKRSDVDIL